MMNSLACGNNTSAVEVTHISSFGIWLLARDKEMFLPYDQFPWFKNQTIASILSVEEPSFNALSPRSLLRGQSNGGLPRGRNAVLPLGLPARFYTA